MEYAPRMVEQLTIAWMVHGLDRHDLLDQGRSVLPYVLDELRLLIRRTGDEHRSSIGNRVGNTLQKRMILRRMSAADAVGLVVEMASRSIRVNDKLIRLGGAEMKYPRLPMIDPDYRVIMSHLTPRKLRRLSPTARGPSHSRERALVPFPPAQATRRGAATAARHASASTFHPIILSQNKFSLGKMLRANSGIRSACDQKPQRLERRAVAIEYPEKQTRAYR